MLVGFILMWLLCTRLEGHSQLQRAPRWFGQTSSSVCLVCWTCPQTKLPARQWSQTCVKINQATANRLQNQRLISRPESSGTMIIWSEANSLQMGTKGSGGSARIFSIKEFFQHVGPCIILQNMTLGNYFFPGRCIEEIQNVVVLQHCHVLFITK